MDESKADEAARRLRAMLRAANGGVLPTGVVDELIAERRAEAAREEAEDFAADERRLNNSKDEKRT
jgi:hypothetical protein